MLRFIASRLLQSAMVLLVMSFIIYGLIGLMPGDPIDIMVNSNPETVSTDYDTSDILFFEPLTTEDVLNICDKLQPDGVIVQFGGQTPLNLAKGLEAAGVLQATDELVMSDVKDLYYAYVLFDRYRSRAVKELLAELERRGISSIGRYGLWEHTSMEDAIAQGQQVAMRVRMRAAA